MHANKYIGPRYMRMEERTNQKEDSENPSRIGGTLPVPPNVPNQIKSNQTPFLIVMRSLAKCSGAARLCMRGAVRRF